MSPGGRGPLRQTLQRRHELVVVGPRGGPHGHAEAAPAGLGRGWSPGIPLGASVSPVWAASRGSATKSPATASSTGTASRPRRVSGRAAARPTGCAGWSTRRRAGRCPTAPWPAPPGRCAGPPGSCRPGGAAGPSGSQVTSRVVSPATDLDRRPLVGGGGQLHQQAGQPVDPHAGQSEQHSTGNTDARGDAAGHGQFELAAREGLAVEVAGHQIVVADHDAFHQLLVDDVLVVDQVLGYRADRAGPGGPDDQVVDGGRVVEQIDDAAEVLFLALSAARTGAIPAPKRPRTSASTRSKSARSGRACRSTTTRGRPNAAAARQASSVCACTPSVALTTTTARSAVARAAMASAAKSALPGASSRLTFTPSTVNGAMARDTESWREISSGSKSQTVVPRSTVPWRGMAPVAASRASASVVLPGRRGGRPGPRCGFPRTTSSALSHPPSLVVELTVASSPSPRLGRMVRSMGKRRQGEPAHQ